MPNLLRASAHNFSASQAQLLQLAVRCASILGLLGAFSTCLAYVLLSSFRRSLVSRLALAIAVADLVATGAQSFGRLGPQSGADSSLCLAQATLQQFGELASVLLVAGIGVQLLLVSRGCQSAREIRKADKLWIPICGTAALAASIAPLFLKDDHGSPVYGDGYLWCYVTSNAAKFYWILYTPMIGTGVFCAVVLVHVRFAGWLRRRRRLSSWTASLNFRPDEHEIYALPGTIAVYIIAYLITWIPIVSAHLLRFASSGDNLYLRTLTMAVFLPARGFANALASFYQVWSGRRIQREERQRQTRKLQQMSRHEWTIRREREREMEWRSDPKFRTSLDEVQW